MSYTPTNWKSGDVVTSAKLNKLEQGVAGAGDVTIVHAVNETLDMTAGAILDAAQNRIVVLVVDGGDSYQMGAPLAASYFANSYHFVAVGGAEFSASAADEYPSMSSGN